MEPFLSRSESEASRPTNGRMPKPFTNIVVSPCRTEARLKVFEKAPVGTAPAPPRDSLSTNVDKPQTNCGQVRCEARRGRHGEVVHSTCCQPKPM